MRSLCYVNPGRKRRIFYKNTMKVLKTFMVFLITEPKKIILTFVVILKDNKMDIFVGSLPFKIKSDQLRALFEVHGEVESVKIIMDKITRQNKGFAFVVMPNHHEAALAIKEMNGKEIMGRTIIVTKSEEKEPESKRKKFGKGGTNFKGNFGTKEDKPFAGKSGFSRPGGGSTRGANAGLNRGTRGSGNGGGGRRGR